MVSIRSLAVVCDVKGHHTLKGLKINNVDIVSYGCFFLGNAAQNDFPERYNGYLLANRDAPSRCTATDCLVQGR